MYKFLAPSVYILIYVQRVQKNVYTSEGAKKMYTHFKRCHLCKMCINFTYIYTYINIMLGNDAIMRYRSIMKYGEVCDLF